MTNRTIGISIEFKSLFFYFVNLDYNIDNINNIRKKAVAERIEINQILIIDTRVSTSRGKLNIEYILDGRNIKVSNNNNKIA